jgi:hypothetical protein
MNAIVSIVTAASVLVHVVLGCAAHHAHGAQIVCCLTGAADQSPKPVQHQCCKHKDDSTTHTAVADYDESAPSQPLHKSCDEDRCTAVLASKVIDSVTPVASMLDSPACLVNPPATNTPAMSADYASSQHDLGPPLRPHLCFCVLLI